MITTTKIIIITHDTETNPRDTALRTRIQDQNPHRFASQEKVENDHDTVLKTEAIQERDRDQAMDQLTDIPQKIEETDRGIQEIDRGIQEIHLETEALQETEIRDTETKDIALVRRREKDMIHHAATHETIIIHLRQVEAENQ